MRFPHATLATLPLLAVGCAVAPPGPSDGSVTHDVVDYLHREWPLTGPPAIPADAQHGAACSCCRGAALPPQAGAPLAVGVGPWAAVAGSYAPDPPPAVPLDPGPPGRFFPVPARPVFAPQAPTGVGFGPIAEAAGGRASI